MALIRGALLRGLLLSWALVFPGAQGADLSDPFDPGSAGYSRCRQEGLERFEHHRTEDQADHGAWVLSRQRFESRAEDVVYRTVEGQALRATWYLPVARPGGPELPAGGAPLVIQVHGGGWIGGERSQLEDLAHLLARSGFAVVSPDYRLAPRDPFPAALGDLAFLLDHLASALPPEVGVDLSRGITLTGFSAGANLVEQLALTYSGQARIARVVALAGRADLLIANGGGPDYSPTYLGASREQAPDLYRAASPVYQIQPFMARPGVQPPSFLIAHQLPDVTVPWEQGCRFHLALGQRGIFSKLLLLPEATPQHGPVGRNRAIYFRVVLRFLETS